MYEFCADIKSFIQLVYEKVAPLIIRDATFYHSRHSSVISSSDSKPAIRAAVSINS